MSESLNDSLIDLSIFLSKNILKILFNNQDTKIQLRFKTSGMFLSGISRANDYMQIDAFLVPLHPA
jgi:hypothetical protein